MPDDNKPKNAEFFLDPYYRQLWHFAALVRDLRVVQKAGGVGYKTPAVNSVATALEQKIDAAIAKILA
jgi:hypothetical protein